MTNVQLWLSVGLPSLLIVLSWITNNTRFDRIEKRLDSHDERFGKLEAKMDTRFDAMIAAVHADTLEIMRAMTSLHERVAVVETKQRS